MRVRISYSKEKSIRFTSALDMQRIWERSVRRCLFPLSYSHGFHPRPRIQLGVPLPLGFIGRDEKVDIWLDKIVQLEEIRKMLKEMVPNGIIITHVQEIALNEKPLISSIHHSDYHAYFFNHEHAQNQLRKSLQTLLEKKEIIRIKRNGKEYDLRPLILNLAIKKNDQGNPFLFLRLCSQQDKTGRADEVLFALGFSINDFIIERIGSYSV